MSPLLVTNGSRLLDWLRCPAYYRYRLRYRDPDEDTHAVDFGSAIHAGLEEWYRPDAASLPTMDDESAIQAFRAAVDWPAHDAEAKEVETSGYGETMLRCYFDHYRQVDRDLFRRVLAVEKTLTAKIVYEDITVVLVGRLDAIVEDHEGRLWHLQHKTASAYTSPASYVEDLRLSPHETIYKAIAISNDLPLVGSWINMLRKKVIPRSGVSSWDPFHRDRVVVPRTHVRRWFEEDLPAMVSLIVEGYDWRNTAACTKWNRVCEYRPFCSGMPFDEGDWIAPEPDYVDETRQAIENGDLPLAEIPTIPLDSL